LKSNKKKSKDKNNSNLYNAYPSIKQKARGVCTLAGHTSDDPIYYKWLSGLIDGDGHFYLTKDGKVILTITTPAYGAADLRSCGALPTLVGDEVDKRDINSLQLIQSKLGGKMYIVANKKQ
jgi:hypothetical protein